MSEFHDAAMALRKSRQARIDATTWRLSPWAIMTAIWFGWALAHIAGTIL